MNTEAVEGVFTDDKAATHAVLALLDSGVNHNSLRVVGADARANEPQAEPDAPFRVLVFGPLREHAAQTMHRAGALRVRMPDLPEERAA